ncbi:MAG: reprolysin-like metallopeptidase [Bacteroidia bacterium]
MKTTRPIAIWNKSVRNALTVSLFTIFILLPGKSFSQNSNLWQDADPARLSQQASRDIKPDVYRTVTLDVNALKSFLITTSRETVQTVTGSQTILTLPMPDGTFQDFRIVESPIMATELANKYPEIKTYLGQGIDDPHAHLRFDWTYRGFHAMIISPSGWSFIDPYSRDENETYISYYKKDFKTTGKGFFPCLTEDIIPLPVPEFVPSGDELRTYRLALAADSNYYNFQGGTVALTLSGMVTSMNRVNGVYEMEVAIRMILIGNTDDLIFSGSYSPYPYTETGACALRPENQTIIDNVIGSANYDIGHLFAMSSGGCATSNSVCNNSTKAYGVTGTGNPVGDPFDIDYVCHEIGHQFNAAHTWNGTQGSCSAAQYASTSAYEPGSGSTIMAYAGICGLDNLQNNSDPYFHTRSFDQIVAYSSIGGGNGCAVVTNIGNSAPVVNAGPGGFTIPISTPFRLTGSAIDPDGDPLTYCWEQYDLGPSGAPDVCSAIGPIFRSYNPVASPARIFPRLQDLLNNTTATGEVLPCISRTLNFRLTARDNKAGGGGVDYASTSVDVTATAGPFLVTYPNAAVSWCTGTTETITWDVANTTSAPVSANNVNIKLSIDGGQTFPITLAANTPNDGSQNITVPNNPVVGNARVMVEAAGNIFFDISNTNFTINSPPAFTSHPANVAAEWGDNVSFSVSFTGDPTPGVQWQRSTNGGGTFSNIGGETNSTLNLSCVTLDMDGYQYKAVLTNICGVVNSNAATLTVAPRNANATITVDPDPQQYSDKVDISVTITDANICGESAATGADVYIGTQLMGTITFSTNGSNLEGSLDNVALLEPSPYGTAPTGQMAPGLQNVTIVLIGVNPNFNISNPGTTLQILPEDARAYYTGACFASTSGAKSSSAIITLSATIRDITAELGDPDWDACPGDIRNATLTFINRETNTIIASNVPIGLVDPNDPLTAVGTYDWNVNIAGNSETFTIGIIIDGYYTRDDSDDDVLVTVSKPLSDFVTGGGFIILQNSAGTVSGDMGSKNNFGFNVKFNKKGNNLQGNITTLVRRTEVDGVHVYKIKANNIQSLAVQPSVDGGKATINSKASIQDVTDPNNVISVAGNTSLQIKMSDWGNPGTQDSIAITIWEMSGGLWYASNWTGTMTAEQPLAAGNLNVATNNSFSRIIPDIVAGDISVYPNPSSGYFSLVFTAEEKGLFEIDLVDVMGKTIVNMLYNAEAGENVAAIEADHIATGIYSLILKNENAIMGTQRVFVK